MGAIRVSIGASVDPSLMASLAKVEQATARAYGKMRDASGRFSKGQAADAAQAATKTEAAQARAAEAQLRASARLDAQIARIEAQATARTEREAQKRTRAAMREFDERLRASKKAAAAEERDILKVAKAAERAETRKVQATDRRQRAEGVRFGRDVGNRALSNMGGMARFGMGIAGQMARGAGVSLDIGSSVDRNVELEKRAVDLANAGYNPNSDDPRDRTRRDAGDIQGRVKAAADATGSSRLDAMAGLQAYVGKTGNLSEGLDMIGELSRLSKATGTDLADMVDAAGDVSSALSDLKGEEKLKRVQAVMKTIAGQGKLGAVEIKDLASQMAKLGANATAFEGDAADNVAMLGAFAQMARQKGGASSATMAATSVASMVNTFKTPARMKAFKEEGIDVVNERGMLRNPQQILMAALAKTGGDPERFKKMFANVQGARAVEGYATTFRQARGSVLDKGGTEEEATAAGLKAVSAEFEKMKQIAMGEGEIRESLNRSLETQASKSQMFNNRMDDVVAGLQSKMAPALERAAPGLIKLADATAGVIAWAAENPGKMIALAIVGSIAKAGVEAAVSRAIGSVFERAAGSAAGGGGPGGAAGKGLALGAAAVVGWGVGSELDAADAEGDKAAENRQTEASVTAQNAAHALRMANDDESRTRAIAEAQKARTGLKARLGGAGDADMWGEVLPNYASAAANWVTGGSVGRSLGKQSQDESDYDSFTKNAQQLVELAAATARVEAAVQNLGGKTLRVEVTNPTPGAGPGVDPSGRTPAPGPWR